MTEIQKTMFAEMQDNALFAKALHYGASYLNEIAERNVYPTDKALEALKYFDEELPSGPGGPMEVLDQLQRYGAPATVTHGGGRYFGFVNGSVVPAGLAAKLLATFWDQNTAMYVLSPVCAKLEQVVEQWLKSIFHLPAHTVAGFVSGTSTANLSGLAAARFRLLKNQGWDINQRGLINAPPVRIIAGKEAHSTILKALAILGFGTDNIQFVDTDEQGRIIPGLVPELNNNTLLILSAGNVNSGSYDDFSALCVKAKQAGAWVHIDGAFGLWAAASSQLAYLTNGIELADSWAVDGHKTLNTPYDCGIVLCADKEALASALHMSAGYIMLSEQRDGMFYTPEMSRRSRIIELWATMKYLGIAGIDQMVYGLHERAKQFASELAGIKGFSILNDVVFNQVLLACDTDALTEKVLRRIQEDRVCWAGGSSWKGRKVIRLSVCSWATTERDITLSVSSFRKAVQE